MGFPNQRTLLALRRRNRVECSSWRTLDRTRSGGSHYRNPSFDATYGNLAIEYTLDERFSLYLDSRYYTDTGEIENAFLFTNAAPGTISRKFGLGLKWTSETWSGRFYIAPISSKFEATEGNVDFFQNLYQDRDCDCFPTRIEPQLLNANRYYK